MSAKRNQRQGDERDVERAVSVLWKAGFTKKMSAFISCTASRSGIEEVMESIAFLKELGSRINLTELAPIKGTQSWDELKRSGVITEDLDPLLTNNSIFPLLFSGYNTEESKR